MAEEMKDTAQVQEPAEGAATDAVNAEAAKELELLKEYHEVNTIIKEKEDRKKELNKELKLTYGRRIVAQIRAKAAEERTADEVRILNSGNPEEEALKLNKLKYTFGNMTVSCTPQDKSKINEDRALSYIHYLIDELDADMDRYIVANEPSVEGDAANITDELREEYLAYAEYREMETKRDTLAGCIVMVEKLAEDNVSVCIDHGYIIPVEFKEHCIDEILIPTLTVRQQKVVTGGVDL